MEATDTASGGNRRDFLRKGLVAGGIVATAPVVTTFGQAAAAAIASGGANNFQTARGTTTGANLTAGAMADEAPNDGGTCEPGGWDTSNNSVDGDFETNGGSASITSITRLALVDSITVSIALPTTCAFNANDGSTVAAQAALRVTYTNGGGNQQTLVCATATTVNQTSAREATVTYAATIPTGAGAHTNLRVARLRLNVSC